MLVSYRETKKSIVFGLHEFAPPLTLLVSFEIFKFLYIRFEIPHILDSICGYLALYHLAVCVRVSKPWSCYFSPTLYFSLCFPTEAEDPHRSAKGITNLRHIAPKNLEFVQAMKATTLSEPLWDDYDTYSVSSIKGLQLHWYQPNYVDTERCIPKACCF